MTQIDFYILEKRDPDARLTLACRIAEKALQQSQRAFVATADDAESTRLDTLLWTFSQGSFVPHRVVQKGEASAPREPVLIGTVPPPDAAGIDVVINLSPEVPEHFDRYPRVAEIVDADAERRARGRERFRHYRDHGCDPNTHKL